MQFIIDQGQPWTDPDFKPDISSLFDPKIDEGSISDYNKYSWKRISQIYKKPEVFKNSISPDDISQGALGNCYFLSALSSLAEFQQNIENRFETKEVNSAGIYLLTLYVNGVLTPIIVDDWIPVTRNNKPAFSSTHDEELWVILLEKAWAKLHKTYARTEGGLPSFAV